MLDRPRLRLEARFDAPVIDLIDMDVRLVPIPRPPELPLGSPSVDEETSPHSEERARLCPSRRGRAELFAEGKDGTESCRSENESEKDADMDVSPDANIVCFLFFVPEGSKSDRESVPPVLPLVVAMVLLASILSISE